MEEEYECPHCKNHQYVYDTELNWYDGDRVEIVCRNCNENFYLLGFETIDYVVEDL